MAHVLTARSFMIAATAIVGLTAASASAHLHVSEPAARHEMQKRGPCGAGADDPRGVEVHRFRPGQTITVQWDEFVDHPGHYRISFDPDGQDDFVDPAGFDAIGEGPPILLDGVPDRDGGGMYSQEVTLPDVTCDRCTLQVVQVMTDKPPYGDGDDLYYQCVDLVLSPDGEVDPNPAAGSGDAGCGCRGAASGGAPGGAWLAALALLRRRRR